MALKQFTVNGWIAADKSGEVHFFFVKPLRGQTRWLTTQHNVEVEFPNIKWEDEPQEATICCSYDDGNANN